MLSDIVRSITGTPVPTRNDCKEPSRYEWEDNSRSLGWGPKEGEGRCDYPSVHCPKYASFACPMGCSVAPVAVLSTTVLPVDGTYRIGTLATIPTLAGIPHYVGHPATKEILEGLGAVPAPTKLFEGLKVGEAALCFSLRQGIGSRPVEGFSAPHQEATLEDLVMRVIWRVK